MLQLLKRFSESQVTGQARDQTKCSNGGGMNFRRCDIEAHLLIFAFCFFFAGLQIGLLHTDIRKLATLVNNSGKMMLMMMMMMM